MEIVFSSVAARTLTARPWPFAGDRLPKGGVGQAVAVADKLDTLAGVFSIGKKPTGNRDPFGLRRAALGVIRILIECGLDVDLRKLLAKAVSEQPKGKLDNEALIEDLYHFISDRLRRYFLDRDSGLATETFEAVRARQPDSLLDFDRRLAAAPIPARCLASPRSSSTAKARLCGLSGGTRTCETVGISRPP